MGLSTDRCDRRAAGRVVDAAYRAAAMSPPPLKIWMDSPLGGVVAAAFVGHIMSRTGEEFTGMLRVQHEASIGGYLRSVRDELWGVHRMADLNRQTRAGGRPSRWRVRAQIDDELAVLNPLNQTLGSLVREQLGFELEGLNRHRTGVVRGRRFRVERTWSTHRMRRRLGRELRDQFALPVGRFTYEIGGRLVAHECRPRRFLRDFLPTDPPRPLSVWGDVRDIIALGPASQIAGLATTDRYAGLLAAMREIGWWWPTRVAAIMSDRPTMISRDSHGGLHADTGPALRYADCFAVCAWHGTPVPADVVRGEGWRPERILREVNAEVRRCAIERRGWDRFITETGMVEVGDPVPDPGNPGQVLVLYDLPARVRELDGRASRILLATNGSTDRDGTRRRFGLAVPGATPDALAAAAWLHDVSPADYARLARRT